MGIQGVSQNVNVLHAENVVGGGDRRRQALNVYVARK